MFHSPRWIPLGLNDWFLSLCSPKDSQESSPAPQFKSISSWVLSLFMLHFSHPYMDAGKTIALTIQTLVGKVMSLLNCLCHSSLPKEQFSSVQSLSHVQLFASPWTEACQASLSITNSGRLLKLMSIELVMPSNHLILCCPLSSLLQSFPASGFLQISQLLASGDQSVGVSASASVLPMNIQN